MKKKTARKLRQIAENLGEIQTRTMTEVPIKGWELLLSGFGKGPGAKYIRPEGDYFLKVPTIVKHSTKKELKRQMKKNGVEGVSKVVRGEIQRRNELRSRIKSNEK